MTLVTSALAQQVIGRAIDVHRAIGPGLYESIYEECLAHELTIAGLSFTRQVPLPFSYRGLHFPRAYRADLIIEGGLLLELKCLERVLPVHEAQILTHLRLARVSQGLLINFNSRRLKDGLKSFLMGHEGREGMKGVKT
jgi:GxxExxY protein